MKKLSRLPVILTSCFVMMFTSLSCKKENAGVIPGTVEEIEFVANGQSFKWNGPTFTPSEISNVWFPDPVWNGASLFVLGLIDPNNPSGNQLSIAINSTTPPSLGTYTITIDTTTTVANAPHNFVLGTNNKTYASIDIGDYGTVTITTIHNNGMYADGTFSAQMTEYTKDGPTTTKLIITNGKFKNVLF